MSIDNINRRDFLSGCTKTAGGIAASFVLVSSQETVGQVANSVSPPKGTGRKLSDGYRLPELRFGYHAFEPFISESCLRQHHLYYHGSHVKGFNQALSDLSDTTTKESQELAQIHQRLQYHANGHFNHMLFWENITPQPVELGSFQALSSQIVRDFGSIEAFIRLFLEAARSLENEGWGVLLWQAGIQRLLVTSTQDGGLFPSSSALLVIDLSEHAYLDSCQSRETYLQQLWKFIDWACVAERFIRVTQPLGEHWL